MTNTPMQDVHYIHVGDVNPAGADVIGPALLAKLASEQQLPIKIHYWCLTHYSQAHQQKIENINQDNSCKIVIHHIEDALDDAEKAFLSRKLIQPAIDSTDLPDHLRSRLFVTGKVFVTFVLQKKYGGYYFDTNVLLNNNAGDFLTPRETLTLAESVGDPDIWFMYQPTGTKHFAAAQQRFDAYTSQLNTLLPEGFVYTASSLEPIRRTIASTSIEIFEQESPTLIKAKRESDRYSVTAIDTFPFGHKLMLQSHRPYVKASNERTSLFFLTICSIPSSVAIDALKLLRQQNYLPSLTTEHQFTRCTLVDTNMGVELHGVGLAKTTLFHEAAYWGHEAVLDYLLSCIDQDDPVLDTQLFVEQDDAFFDATPMELAAIRGNIGCLILLANKKLTFNIKDTIDDLKSKVGEPEENALYDTLTKHYIQFYFQNNITTLPVVAWAITPNTASPGVSTLPCAHPEVMPIELKRKFGRTQEALEKTLRSDLLACFLVKSCLKNQVTSPDEIELSHFIRHCSSHSTFILLKGITVKLNPAEMSEPQPAPIAKSRTLESSNKVQSNAISTTASIQQLIYAIASSTLESVKQVQYQHVFIAMGLLLQAYIQFVLKTPSSSPCNPMSEQPSTYGFSPGLFTQTTPPSGDDGLQTTCLRNLFHP